MFSQEQTCSHSLPTHRPTSDGLLIAGIALCTTAEDHTSHKLKCLLRCFVTGCNSNG